MTMKSLLFALSVASLLPAAAFAAVQTQDVKYAVDGTEYVGFLAYDDANDAKRPGILIAPEWIGLNDYSRGRAKQLAEMGYVAFVFDPYGGGKNAADVKQASEWSGALKADRPELRKRITAGLETLKKQDRVNPDKIAAIGYCFGGTTVLELARSGADIAGVVSFHGGLSTTMPAKAGEVKAKVLVCHGAIDPFVPPEEVAAFEKEMQAANVDWQLISYGNAVHSFTNPAAKGQVKGAEYNEKADKRSWEAMKVFLGDLFDRRALLNDGANAVFETRRHRRVVFVFDGTMAMMQRSGDIRQIAIRAISQLTPDQSFNFVYVFGNGSYTSAHPGKWISSTDYRKRLAYAFIDDLTLQKGEFDPIPALRSTFALDPDVIYLVTASYGDVASHRSVLREVSTLNPQRHVTVNTLRVENKGALGAEVLAELAQQNGGTFREFEVAGHTGP